MGEYTGREIAIFTDIHGLLEPLKAILDDIKKREIEEIYSLGDNIGSGPNPLEVLKLLEDNNVNSIRGNAEDYIMLGLEPFPYLTQMEIDSANWTKRALGEEGKKIIASYPHSIELKVGGKKVGLCHFPNDVRFDFDYYKTSTWAYQNNFDYMFTGKRFNNKASEQFKYTNSKEQLEKMKEDIANWGILSYKSKGVLSALNEPLFKGKSIFTFDDIFFGHVHWELNDDGENTKFHSLRGAAMAYRNDPMDEAYYIILKEKIYNKGFDIERVFVKYDREKMEESILNSTNKDDKIKKYTCININNKKK